MNGWMDEQTDKDKLGSGIGEQKRKEERQGGTKKGV